MNGLAHVHGCTFRSAWFRFRRCMDGLKNSKQRDKMTRLIDHLVLQINRRVSGRLHPPAVQRTSLFSTAVLCLSTAALGLQYSSPPASIQLILGLTIF